MIYFDRRGYHFVHGKWLEYQRLHSAMGSVKFPGAPNVILFTVTLACMILWEVFASELSEELWIQPGEAVDLRCRPQFLADIYPNAKLRWMKDGESLEKMVNAVLQSTGYLRLTDLQIQDSGVYQCKNTFGDNLVTANSVRLHVGASVQEQLLKSEGPWLSTSNSMGIPNVWVMSFASSILVIFLWIFLFGSLRVWYKLQLKKYADKDETVP